MQLFGYANPENPAEKIVSAELAEVTLCAMPAELRRIAEFLSFCAGEMERMGAEYSHVHLADHMKEFEGSPHLTVFRSS